MSTNVVAVIDDTYGTVFGLPAAALSGVMTTAFGAAVYVLLNVQVSTVPDCGVPTVVNDPQVSDDPATAVVALIPVEFVDMTGAADWTEWMWPFGPTEND